MYTLEQIKTIYAAFYGWMAYHKKIMTPESFNEFLQQTKFICTR